MYSTARTEGSFCGENAALACSFQDMDYPYCLGKYLLSQQDAAVTFYQTHHQYITGLQQHCRALQGSPLMAGEAQVFQHCSATLTLQRHMIQSCSRPDLLSL